MVENYISAHNHHRPFQSSYQASVVNGPTCITMNISDIYDVAASVAASPVNGGAVARTLQPFDISTSSSIFSPVLKSPVAGGMAASDTLGLFPFTSAQWKELETQAMIYKYLMASLPLPPDLLSPITRYLSDCSSLASSNPTLVRGYLRSSNNKDPEPWRCKRTDGKKWRCSRDVAPDQKYCERHAHRGRPRSRKPVEQVRHRSDFNNNNFNKKGRFQSHVHFPPNPLFSNTRVTGDVGYLIQNLGSTTAQPYLMNPVFPDRSNNEACDFESVVSASSYKEPRTIDWMVKGEAVPMVSTSATDQQWQQHLMQAKTGLTTNENYYCNNTTSHFNQDYEVEPLNLLNSYTSFVDSEGQSNETPRSFIDAWSNNTEMKDTNGNFSNNDSVSSHGKLSLSSLNLLMGSNNTSNDEMGHLQMGLGLVESDKNYGGPLAEVLRPAVAGSASSSEFLVGGNGDSDSPQATTVSSPFQKTLASLSDSSNCSSPTLVAFQWLN